MQITIRIGKTDYPVDGETLPPVGTRMYGHKHLCDGGGLLEVERHEWELKESVHEDGCPEFHVTILTRIVED